MNYPEYVEVEGKRYKINTDFRVAIQCNKIAEDDSIGDFERALAIIYTLYGDEGLEHQEHYEKLLELAKTYLSCGKEIKTKKNEKPDMDFEYDYGLIWASFMSDYNGMDIDKIEMHWWKFFELLNGLSSSELGNSCILNKIRAGRRYNPKEIKDSKARQEFIEWQKSIALPKKKKQVSKEQQAMANEIFNRIGLRRE